MFKLAKYQIRGIRTCAAPRALRIASQRESNVPAAQLRLRIPHEVPRALNNDVESSTREFHLKHLAELNQNNHSLLQSKPHQNDSIVHQTLASISSEIQPELESHKREVECQQEPDYPPTSRTNHTWIPRNSSSESIPMIRNHSKSPSHETQPRSPSFAFVRSFKGRSLPLEWKPSVTYSCTVTVPVDPVIVTVYRDYKDASLITKIFAGTWVLLAVWLSLLLLVDGLK